MFDFLDDLPLARVTSAVHYAIRCLNYPAPVPQDTPPEDQSVALRLLDEINAREGPHWAPRGEVAQKYIQALSEIVLTRTKRELGSDPNRGRALLEQLRESFARERGGA